MDDREMEKTIMRARVALLAMILTALAVLARSIEAPDSGAAEAEKPARFIDLSLLVAPEYPCTWPTFPPFQINHYERIGPRSAYNSDILVLDGNTGTQLDVPPHSVTAPDSGLPNAGRFGLSHTDKVEAWQFVGEACVIDCGDLLIRLPTGGAIWSRKRGFTPGRRSIGRSARAMWCCFAVAIATNTTSRCRKDAGLSPIPSRARRRRGPIRIPSAWSISPHERS
jgi:hypothetical protein